MTLPRELAEALDAWIAQHEESLSRPEAIRRLIRAALAKRKRT